MTQAPYVIHEAKAERPLLTLQLRVYADRIVTTELGGPCAVHHTPGAAAADVERRCARVRAS